MRSALLTTLLMIGLSPVAVAADVQTVEVKLDSYTIKPDRIVVKANQPVTLKVTNDATFIPHNLVIKAPAAGTDIRIDLSAGKSAKVSFTPTRPGSYEMFCDKTPPIGKTHREKGMHGVLIVE